MRKQTYSGQLTFEHFSWATQQLSLSSSWYSLRTNERDEKWSAKKIKYLWKYGCYGVKEGNKGRMKWPRSPWTRLQCRIVPPSKDIWAWISPELVWDLATTSLWRCLSLKISCCFVHETRYLHGSDSISRLCGWDCCVLSLSDDLWDTTDQIKTNKAPLNGK